MVVYFFMEVESIFYKSLGSDDLVRCELCSRFCVISNGDVGFCGTQRNVDGKLFACNFGVFSSVNVDPIEKKPLYHFLPGSFTFSLGGFSCNMSCLNCQNYIISQDLGQDSQKINLLPDEVVKMTSDNDCPSISWTYNEPTLHLQYILETAKKSKPQKPPQSRRNAYRKPLSSLYSMVYRFMASSSSSGRQADIFSGILRASSRRFFPFSVRALLM